MAGNDFLAAHSRIRRLVMLAMLAVTVAIMPLIAGETGLASAAALPTEVQEFVPDPGKRVNYEWGDIVHVIAIDAKGNVKIEKEVPAAIAFGSVRGPVPGVIVRFTKPLKTYEYRSGRLILGTMTPTGEFIPEIGSTVKKFEDYKYGSDPWIWNLPGYFRPVDKAGAGKGDKPVAPAPHGPHQAPPA